MSLTVRELRKALAGLPDDLEVLAWKPGCWMEPVPHGPRVHTQQERNVCVLIEVNETERPE